MENEKIVRTIIHTGQQPTESQILEIERAASMPIVPDEDAPELTLEQYAEMAAIARNLSIRVRNGGGQLVVYAHLLEVALSETEYLASLVVYYEKGGDAVPSHKRQYLEQRHVAR